MTLSKQDRLPALRCALCLRVAARVSFEIALGMFVVDTHVDLDVCQFSSKLRAPYAMLSLILGPPFKDRPEKTSTYWSLRSEADDEVGAYIKDIRGEDDDFDVKHFRTEPVYDWTVGATNQAVGITFCRWLSKQVITKLGEVKTLTPEAKAELNKLVAEGVPLGDAMKRVTLQRPTDLDVRFAWPIKTTTKQR
jgi:hypothetical protein